VAHGMIVALIFQADWNVFAGKYALYLSQLWIFTNRFILAPQWFIEGTVEQKVESLRVIKIKTLAKAVSDNAILVDGTAMVKLLK